MAPAGAHPWIAEVVHWRTRARAGEGAVREVCDVLLAAHGHVAEVLAGRTRHGLMPDRPRPEALDAHDAVADAIRARDPEAAERAMTVITTEIRAALSDLH